MKPQSCSDNLFRYRVISTQEPGVSPLLNGIVEVLTGFFSFVSSHRTTFCVAVLALAQCSICFGQIGQADLQILHAWWQSDPGAEERSPVLNTHLTGMNTDPANSSSTPPTTFRIYWADGPSLSNKMALVYSEIVPSIASGNQWDRDDSLIPASSLIPPEGASHVILVIDEDNLVQESIEANNIKSFSLAVDLQVATPLLVFPAVPGLSFAYRVRFRGWFDHEWVQMPPTTAQLFWANGPTIQDRTSTIPIYSHPIEGVFWRLEANQTDVQVDASLFHDPPVGTTCVLLVLGSVEGLAAAESLASDSDPTNNAQMVATEKFLVAEVILIKGTVSVFRNGVALPLSVKDRVFHSDVVTTADKSLIKLRYIDGSESTLGSKSEFYNQ